MPKKSSGILAYRLQNGRPEVLLVHPGGPFWKNKDAGVWSIPKGEYDEHEDALDAARREFFEETGNTLPLEGYKLLQPVKLKSGKMITAWAVEADFETPLLHSNTFEMEWPPRSGKKQLFAEVDKACWFTVEQASEKLNPAQVALVSQLVEALR